jgi:tRNA U34 5-methylaminomethyl-2-thiouridine-forming methyltransferase MnmC
MKKLPPNHQLVETLDGSNTLFSERFQEACHSSTGARTETLLHYISGCRIKEHCGSYNPFVILEVGFGLGVGFLTTMEALAEGEGQWHFLSLELDRELLEWFREEHKEHPFLKSLRWEGPQVLKAQDKNITLTILAGDARQTLLSYLKDHSLKWHAVYQDAFSPKRNPILWTVEWFSLLKEYAHQDCILSTYSASSSIRKSLHTAGWAVKKGQKFGPKRSSTRAYLTGQTDADILDQLNRSPVDELRDDNIDSFLLK